jgi:hypothetical protein
MQMTTILRSAIVLGLLGSASAQATMTLPSNVGTGSSLFATVFDTSNGESFTTDLGLLYNNLVNTAVAPGTILAGAFSPLSYNLNMSIFADNNPANIRFNVYAGDSSGINSQNGIVMTATATPAQTNGQMDAVNNLGTQQVLTFNQNCPIASGCAGNYGSETLWGSTINGQFPVGSAAAFNEAIAFYLVTGTTTSSTVPATTTQFADANGSWNWLLASNGTLTFSGSAPAPVPLPAAVWLLLSGLAGFGALGRRSNQKA